MSIENFNFNLNNCCTQTLSSDQSRMINTMLANFNNELDAKYAQMNSIFEAFLQQQINPQSYYSDNDTSYFRYDAKELKDKWTKKKPYLSDEFYIKVVQIAKHVKCDPNDLMALMNAESGINPTAINTDGGATGLIQFMPNTAKEYGTTTQALKQMSAEQQLDYVEKYLLNAKKIAGINKKSKITAGTLYALVYMPARANKNTIATSEEKYYKQGENYKLDKNKDGVISKDELGQRIRDFMA